MNPEIFISLIVENEKVKGEVLDTLAGIDASVFWVKGQAKGKSLATHENNGWAFKAKPIQTVYVDHALRQFWGSFDPKDLNMLASLVENYKLALVLSIAIYCNEIMPSIYLKSEMIKQLAHNNIEIDIDVILR